MPNWLHLTVNFAYHLGLAIWIGGTIVLGALVAPALFRALPRQEAGGIFGPTLRKFSRVRLVAIGVAIAAAIVKYLVWETHTANFWVVIRWGALVVMAIGTTYEIGGLEPDLEAMGRQLGPEVAEDDHRRILFKMLHKRAEQLMKFLLAAALVALFLS